MSRTCRRIRNRWLDQLDDAAEKIRTFKALENGKRIQLMDLLCDISDRLTDGEALQLIDVVRSILSN